MVAGAAEAGWHFGGDAKPSMLANDRVRLVEIVWRPVSRAAHSLNRLADKRGDFSRRRVANELANVVDTLRGDFFRRAVERTAIRVGIDRVMDRPPAAG